MPSPFSRSSAPHCQASPGEAGAGDSEAPSNCLMVEGAAVCAIAAARKLGQGGQQQQLAGKQVVVVCCGGNVAVPTLKKVLDMGVIWS